jgi:phosphomannomutase
MSAHHYFRDFAYCDSGMIPWLLVLQQMCVTGKPLSELVGERMRRFPCSGEINRRIPDVPGAIAAVQSHYASRATSVDHTDGLSMEFEGKAGASGDAGAWRLNLRGSNTEPLIRLNVESRGSAALMQDKTAEVLALLATRGAVAADH